MIGLGFIRNYAVPADPLSSGLVFYSDFGNSSSYPGSGTSMTDISPSALPGTLINGPTYDATYGGLNFIAASTQRVTGTSAVIPTGQNFTASCWFKPSAITTTNDYGLFRNAYDYSPTNVNDGWSLFIRLNGEICVSLGHDTCYAFTNNGILSNGTWANALFTVTNGGTNISLYLNGVLQTNAGSSFPGITINYTNFVRWDIGVLNTEYMTGEIAICRAWNRILSSTEITTEFNDFHSRFGL